MQRMISIDGRDVGFKATALTPRIYRHQIGRDMLSDMAALRKAYNKRMNLPDDATEEEIQEAQLSALDLEVFENTAWVMAYQYDPSIPASPDQWLDTFSTFSIYNILPVIMELWQANQATTSVPKKK